MCFCAIFTGSKFGNDVSEGSNNVSHCKDKDALLAQMPKIPHAEDMTKFNDAVNVLKELPVWY